jgi:hypothetical protein
MLPQCDFVSLHLPLAPSSRKMINAEAIARMRRGAILINTSRGGLVDEEAMVEALQSGQLGGAGIDCFEHIQLHGAGVCLSLSLCVSGQRFSLCSDPHCVCVRARACVRACVCQMARQRLNSTCGCRTFLMWLCHHTWLRTLLMRWLKWVERGSQIW